VRFGHETPPERIQKLIARSGYASRRRAEILIGQGRVTVDGVVVQLGAKADPTSARIAIDEIPLPVAPDLVYYLVYKPVGVVSTAHEPGPRRAVVDLVPAEPRVVPVGRLDVESEGLIVLTNDGDLTLYMTHPRFGVEKTYTALIEGSPSAVTIRRLTQGVELEDGLARAVRVRQVAQHHDSAMIEIVMNEGRKREVRRMLSELGYPVQRLVRTAIGPITDRTLEPGTYRELSVMEVRRLYSSGTHDG